MKTKSTNIVWHPSKVDAVARKQLLKQEGAVLWFTGLSGSGKSTISTEIEASLIKQGIFATTLDGDNVRHGLNKDLNFSDTDRRENIRRISEVTKLFCDANVLVLTAFISPFREDRAYARSLVPEGKFIEIYCNASVEDCEKRDPKGLYAKAREGVIKDFTGISSPYEAPVSPEITLNTGKEDITTSVATVISYLRQKQMIV